MSGVTFGNRVGTCVATVIGNKYVYGAYELGSNIHFALTAIPLLGGVVAPSLLLAGVVERVALNVLYKTTSKDRPLFEALDKYKISETMGDQQFNKIFAGILQFLTLGFGYRFMERIINHNMMQGRKK